ncbi:hypothetical protein BSLA_02r1355 [Burkholderia stabilis]|nr:hypothetical protein BSLA_02r1355 [Burkholderia stabilis]
MARRADDAVCGRVQTKWCHVANRPSIGVRKPRAKRCALPTAPLRRQPDRAYRQRRAGSPSA